VLRSPTFGYVEGVDLDRILAALGDDPEGEVELHVTVGAEVVTGDLIATVRHPDPAVADRVCDELELAVPISHTPDIDLDPSTAIRDIGNIGWTSGSTSKQNPAIAAQSLHALRDLAVRWLREDERADPDPAPVVYPDDDLDTILDAVYSALVVAHESHQHQQAVRVLEAYETLLASASAHHRERLVADLEAMRPLADQLPASPAVDRVRRRLEPHLREGADRGAGVPAR
jgi:hypothetical protein